MTKLRMDVDSLHVESFATADAGGRAGTVRGAEATELCSQVTGPCDTCNTSCAGGPLCDCAPSGCPKASVCCPTV